MRICGDYIQTEMVDDDLLSRIIDAPWMQPRQQQELSWILAANRIAIYMVSNVRDYTHPSDDLSIEYVGVLRDSGWIDYLQAYQNVDFSSTRDKYSLIVIEGKVFCVINVGLHSVFDIKFFKLVGTMPFYFRYTPHGYQYLLSIDFSMEYMRDVIERKYKKIFDAIDYDKLEDMPALEQKEYMEKLGVTDALLKDPLVLQFNSLMGYIDTYEVYFDFFVLTDNTGAQTLAAYPVYSTYMALEYGDTDLISEKIANYAIGIYGGSDTSRIILSIINPRLKEIIESGGKLANRVNQYSLPDAKPEEEKAVMKMTNDLPKEGRGEYTDMLMCLSSRGLLDKLKERVESLGLSITGMDRDPYGESRKKEYLKFFTEHLDINMPYARYSIGSMGSQLTVAEKYQTAYDIASYTRDPFIPHDTPVFFARNFKHHPKDRLSYIIESRIGSGYRALGLPDTGSYYFLRNRAGEIIGMGSGGVRYNIKDLDQSLFIRYMPTIRRMLDYEYRLQNDYEEILQLEPLKPFSKYISIHGVMFRSDEIMRLFYNTPIASAASLVSEYDPPFMSHYDVRVTSYLLNGLIMPYTYYNMLSWEAFVALSDEGTFLYLYPGHHNSGGIYNTHYDIDSAFTLGERMITYLSNFKKSGRYEKLTRKTKTLLTLF